MSEAVSQEVNQVDPDLFSDLHMEQTPLQEHAHALGYTPTQALVVKCTHPPSAVVFDGLPTNDARSQVYVEWRDMEMMSKPRILGSDNIVRDVTPADLNTFDYGFLSLNGARVKNIGFITNADDNNNMRQDFNGVMIEQLYDFNAWNIDANLYRPVLKSSTFYTNTTAFNNVGMTATEQFNPNILFAGNLLAMASENPLMFYSFVGDMFKLGRFRAVAKPNRDQMATWETLPHYHRVELLRNNNCSPTDILDLDPNTAIQVLNVGQLGTDGAEPRRFPSTSQILGNSVRSYGGKAMDGIFSVQRLNTVSPQWLSASNTSRGATIISGLYDCYLYTTSFSGSGFFEPLYDNAVAGTTIENLPILRDTLWSKDMTASYTRFSGLALNPQIGASGVGASMQLLIKKVITGYEVQPCPKSAWAGMLRLAPKPDIMAMQAIMDAFYELKDGFPAKYNFLGVLKTIGQGIIKYAPKVIRGLSAAIGAKPAKQLIRAEKSIRSKGEGFKKRTAFAKRDFNYEAVSKDNAPEIVQTTKSYSKLGARKEAAEVKDTNKVVHAIARDIKQIKLEPKQQRERHSGARNKQRRRV